MGSSKKSRSSTKKKVQIVEREAFKPFDLNEDSEINEKICLRVKNHLEGQEKFANDIDWVKLRGKYKEL